MSDERVVLLWGVPGDPPLAAVSTELQNRACPVVFLDQRNVADTRVELCIKPESGTDGEISGHICFGGTAYDLAAVRSVYPRPLGLHAFPALAKAGPESAAWQHAAAVEESLTTWADLTPSLVVNRPATMFANGSKPFQAAWLAALGFAVPDTLLTTDASAARDFWREHTEVIYKSMSGIRSIVSRLRPEHEERLADLSGCPTQFQQYIPGVEHRAHVVGDKVFACRILCDADDYRYAQVPPEIVPCELPAAVAELCRQAAAAMKLPLAGLDLRCTPEGQWYCFEVNPSPGFTYFAKGDHSSIAEAVADMLAAGEPLY